MTTARLITPPYETYRDLTGAPLENGSINIGESNLDPLNNPIVVYEDLDLTIPVAQPIKTIAGVPYNTSGNAINLYTSVDYSILIRDKSGVTVDAVPLVEGQQVDEWQYSLTATYINNTTFTLVGDQTDIYQVGRACRVTGSVTPADYATIATSVFTTVTTITLDDTVVPADLVESAVSIVGPDSIPTDPQVAINTANIATNTADIATNASDIADRLPLAGGTMTGQIELPGGASGNQAISFDQVPGAPVLGATAGNGTPLTGTPAEIAAETLALPAGTSWTWVEVHFTTTLQSNRNIEATAIKLAGVDQTTFDNFISVTTANSDDQIQVNYYAAFVPTVTGSNLDVEFFAQTASTGDDTASRQMVVIGHSK